MTLEGNLTFKELEELINESERLLIPSGKEAQQSREVVESVAQEVTSILKEYGYQDRFWVGSRRNTVSIYSHNNTYNQILPIDILVKKSKDKKNSRRTILTYYFFKEANIKDVVAHPLSGDSIQINSLNDYIDFVNEVNNQKTRIRTKGHK